MKEETSKTEKPSEKKQDNKTFLIVIVVFLIGIFIGYIIRGTNATDSEKKDVPEMVACTMDVKICPDGSAVSRIPPDCNFSECPEE